MHCDFFAVMRVDSRRILPVIAYKIVKRSFLSLHRPRVAFSQKLPLTCRSLTRYFGRIFAAKFHYFRFIFEFTLFAFAFAQFCNIYVVFSVAFFVKIRQFAAFRLTVCCNNGIMSLLFVRSDFCRQTYCFCKYTTIFCPTSLRFAVNLRAVRPKRARAVKRFGGCSLKGCTRVRFALGKLLRLSLGLRLGTRTRTLIATLRPRDVYTYGCLSYANIYNYVH